MALSTATISYNLADMVGADFDVSQAKVWVTTNVPGGAIADTVGNAVRLGDGLGTLAEDGTGTLSVWTPGTGSNPTSWQTYIHVSYAPRLDGWRPIQRTFGPFTITGDANLADLVAEQEVPPTYVDGVVATLQSMIDQGLKGPQGDPGPAGANGGSDASTADNLVNGTASKAALATVVDPVRRVVQGKVKPGPFSNRNRYHENGASDGVITSETSMVWHDVYAPSTNVELMFTNATGIREQTVVNDNTTKAWIKTASGTLYPVDFAGSATATVPAFGSVWGQIDPAVVLTGGFWVITYVTVSSGGKFPRGPYTRTAKGEGVLAGTSASVTSVTPTANSKAYTASYVRGVPVGNPKATVAISGDSIGAGAVNSNDASLSYIAQALEDAQIPYVVTAQGGEGIQGLQTGNGNRKIMMADCSHVISENGTNDAAQTALTIAQSMALFVAFYSECNLRGQVVYQTTCPPRTNAGNTAPVATDVEAKRVGLNAAFRALPTPLNGVIEMADRFETARDSGLWTTNSGTVLTTDGIHPNTAGHLFGKVTVTATVSTWAAPSTITARLAAYPVGAKKPTRRRALGVAISSLTSSYQTWAQPADDVYPYDTIQIVTFTGRLNKGQNQPVAHVDVNLSAVLTGSASWCETLDVTPNTTGAYIYKTANVGGVAVVPAGISFRPAVQARLIDSSTGVVSAAVGQQYALMDILVIPA